MAFANGRCSADDKEDFAFVGTPTQVVDQLRRFVDLGVDYFILDCSGFPNLTVLEHRVDEVLPAFNG